MPAAEQQLNNHREHTVELNMHALNLNAATQAPRSSASPPDFDFDTPCRYFKSTFARSLSLHNANGLVGSAGGTAGDLHCKSLEFGVNQTNNNNSNGVDSKNSPCSAMDVAEYPLLTQRTCEAACNSKNATTLSLPPPVPARRPTLTASDAAPLCNDDANASGGCGQRQHQHRRLQPQQHRNNNNNNHNFNLSSNTNNSHFKRNIWPRDNVGQEFSAYDHVAKQRKDHDTMLGHASSLSPTLTPPPSSPLPLKMMPSQSPSTATLSASTSTPNTFKVVHEDRMNVEAVILQNQVNTLQWQLKQVETNCDMYRAVMEEVARFFDRYHSQKQQQHQHRQEQSSTGMEHIARSKSMYHVYGIGHEEGACDEPLPVTSYLRARSSTNLVETKKVSAASNGGAAAAGAAPSANCIDNCSYDAMAPENASYTAFKDFTWRRSPKKQNIYSRPNTSSSVAADCAEEKLSQEAFRLARTIHNLLNTSTQQPDLMHHRNSIASLSGYSRLCKVPPAATPATCSSSMHNSTMVSGIGIGASSSSGINSCTATNTNNAAAADACDATAAAANAATSAATVAAANKSNSLAADMLFLRSANVRDSRMSLRSSTDSSVHSMTSSAASSSSKVETDDEPLHFHPTLPLLSTKPPPHGFTTEDESGFSSINSFQDIGVPLSSTLLSNVMLPTASRCYAIHERKAESACGQVHGADASPIITRPKTAAAIDGTAAFNNNSEIMNSPLATPTTAAAATASDSDANAASNATHLNNVVGLPLQAIQDMQPRWDAPAKTYHNGNKLQRFSTLSNEDSSTVLWV